MECQAVSSGPSAKSQGVSRGLAHGVALPLNARPKLVITERQPTITAHYSSLQNTHTHTPSTLPDINILFIFNFWACFRPNGPAHKKLYFLRFSSYMPALRLLQRYTAVRRTASGPSHGPLLHRPSAATRPAALYTPVAICGPFLRVFGALSRLYDGRTSKALAVICTISGGAL